MKNKRFALMASIFIFFINPLFAMNDDTEPLGSEKSTGNPNKTPPLPLENVSTELGEASPKLSPTTNPLRGRTVSNPCLSKPDLSKPPPLSLKTLESESGGEDSPKISPTSSLRKRTSSNPYVVNKTLPRKPRRSGSRPLKRASSRGDLETSPVGERSASPGRRRLPLSPRGDLETPSAQGRGRQISTSPRGKPISPRGEQGISPPLEQSTSRGNSPRTALDLEQPRSDSPGRQRRDLGNIRKFPFTNESDLQFLREGIEIINQQLRLENAVEKQQMLRVKEQRAKQEKEKQETLEPVEEKLDSPKT